MRKSQYKLVICQFPGNLIKIRLLLSAVILLGLLPTTWSKEDKCCGGTTLETGEECCNDKGPYKPDAREGKFSVTFSATDTIKGKISDYLSNIPGVGKIDITAAEVSVVKTVADCCPQDSSQDPIKDGTKGAKASVKFGVKLTDICLWPQGGWSTRSYGPFNLLFVSYTIRVHTGVYLSVDQTTTGEIGYKDDSCDNKTCGFGSATLGFEAKLAPKFEAYSCDKWVRSSQETCSGFDVTPVSITLSASGGGTYHDGGDCDKDWTGQGKVGGISVDTSVSIGGGQISINWYKYDGWSGS